MNNRKRMAFGLLSICILVGFHIASSRHMASASATASFDARREASEKDVLQTSDRPNGLDRYTIGARFRGDGPSFFVDVVMTGSPAEEAGLLPGDQLLAVDGKAVPTDPHEAVKLFMSDRPVPVVLTIARQGKISIIGVERRLFGGHSHTSNEPPPMRYRPYTAGLSVVQRDGRIFVDDMLLSSPALQAGVQIEDELVAVNGYPVKNATARQVMEWLSNSFPIDLTVTFARKGETLVKNITLEHMMNILDRLTVKEHSAQPPEHDTPSHPQKNH